VVEKILADASPEKRLFISLITRDISLVDAFLDIIDNSINAALEPLADDLKTADDYQRLASSRAKPKVKIDITVGSARIVVKDNAPGIPLETARKHVFRFGRNATDTDASDRLSVYGIGLKRAMFKCGNKISIVSDHREGGFELKLNVGEWAKLKEEPWQFEITPRNPAKTDLGTRISITDLSDDVLRRMDDGLFLAQLKDRIARTYSFFIGRVVEITLNNADIPAEIFEIGGNYTSEKFKSGKVSCNITAGIAVTKGDTFRDRNAGWFVFCNGRAVLFADKSSLTGWGATLPIFQPKHRPFLGTIFFVSSDPEALPWTTTKASVNEDSAVWQEAKRHMTTVGRVVIGFLDRRYTDEGTEVASADLQDASGASVSVLKAAVAQTRSFKPPTKPAPKEMKIQYMAKLADIKKIATHLRRPNIGGSEVGRFTFNYFLKNEVGGDE
jgi:hypothetical protein